MVKQTCSRITPEVLKISATIAYAYCTRKSLSVISVGVVKYALDSAINGPVAINGWKKKRMAPTYLELYIAHYGEITRQCSTVHQSMMIFVNPK